MATTGQDVIDSQADVEGYGFGFEDILVTSYSTGSAAASAPPQRLLRSNESISIGTNRSTPSQDGVGVTVR